MIITYIHKEVISFKTQPQHNTKKLYCLEDTTMIFMLKWYLQDTTFIIYEIRYFWIKYKIKSKKFKN